MSSDELLLIAWKNYINEQLKNSDNFQLTSREIKDYAISKLSVSYCNPALLLEVLQMINQRLKNGLGFRRS